MSWALPLLHLALLFGSFHTLIAGAREHAERREKAAAGDGVSAVERILTAVLCRHYRDEGSDDEDSGEEEVNMSGRPTLPWYVEGPAVRPRDNILALGDDLLATVSGHPILDDGQG